MSLWRVRPAKDEDMAFIVDPWRKSMKGSPQVRGAETQAYESEMARVVRRICKYPETRAVVACDAKDEDTLVGFAVSSGTTLHYVYVRKDFRRSGIAKLMLEGVTIDSFTFLPTPEEGVELPQMKVWRFTPRFTL